MQALEKRETKTIDIWKFKDTAAELKLLVVKFLN